MTSHGSRNSVRRAEHTEDIARDTESYHLRITEERNGLKTSKAFMLIMLFCHTPCLDCLATHQACVCTPSQPRWASSRKPPRSNCSNWVFIATSRVADCRGKGPATPFLPVRMFIKSDLDFCVIYPWGRSRRIAIKELLIGSGNLDRSDRVRRSRR